MAKKSSDEQKAIDDQVRAEVQEVWTSVVADANDGNPRIVPTDDVYKLAVRLMLEPEPSVPTVGDAAGYLLLLAAERDYLRMMLGLVDKDGVV